MDQPDVLQNTLHTLMGFILETHHKKLRNIYVYDGVDANVLGLDVLEKSNVPMSSLPMFLAEFKHRLEQLSNYSFQPS